MKNRLLTALWAVTCLLSLQAQAGLIQNGSFEFKNEGIEFLLDYDNGRGPTRPQVGWDVFSNIWGWQTYYGQGVEIQTSGLLGSSIADSKAQDGGFYAELDSHSEDNTKFNSGIFQQIIGLKKGATYELSFWYQPRSLVENSNVMDVFWFDTIYGDSRDLIGQSVRKIVNQNQSTAWAKYTATFIASSDSMTIGFGAGGLDDGKGALLDNVSMNDIPAPSSIILVGLGLFGLLVRKLSSK